MRKSVIIFSIVIFLSCSDGNNHAHIIPESEFNPCIIISDFMTERIVVQEKNKKSNSNLGANKFVYVDPAPIYVSDISGSKGTAETSIVNLEKSKAFIKSRLNVAVYEKTFDAYVASQSISESFSKCPMPKHVYTKNDGLEQIEKITTHNQNQRLAISKELKLYSTRRKELTKKLSREERIRWGEEYSKKESDLAEKFKTKPFVLHRFSRLGINKDKKQVIFYHENFCGRLCAGGAYVVMEYRDHNWVVSGRVMTWIS